MKYKNIFLLSTIIMIMALLIMSINWFFYPIPDNVIRITGVIIIFNLIMLSVSSVKLRQIKK